MNAPSFDADTIRLATFGVGTDLFAVDLMRIREITRPLPVTPVPRAPHGMTGVLDLRGAVIPVFDMRTRFGLPSRAPECEGQARQVILRLDGRCYALVVDHVDDVLTVARGQLRAGPGVLIGPAAEVFHGVCPVGERLALLLNLRRVIQQHDQLFLDELLPPSHGSGT
ncbi:MAG: chemotaxis protein CheW [Deltaproteobacteria bacterium]|nr:chemotaxis protein CheW [Deltaproteobacteria bacterium]